MACWQHIYIEHRNPEIQKHVKTSCSNHIYLIYMVRNLFINFELNVLT